MKIGHRDTTKNVFVIAEIGNNHEGQADLACQMVERAADCGVDAVKFQTCVPELFVSKTDGERLARLKKFQLSPETYFKLKDLATKRGVAFISTPLDLESAEFLSRIVDAFKIASGDNNFLELIGRVLTYQKPTIISGGLATATELKAVQDFAVSSGRSLDQIAFLHCVTSYPVPDPQANLGALVELRSLLRTSIGYSDHTLGIEACVLAVALGARIVEKHFTLDKNFSTFRDHQLSAEPHEMKTLVERIRAAEVMIGDPVRKIQSCEEPLKPVARRSACARVDLKAGEQVSPRDIIWMRPGTGFAPGSEAKIVGKTLKRALHQGELIQSTDIESAF